MLERFKKTGLGKAIYRLSRRPTVGPPLRRLAAAAQSEAFQPAHLRPDNLAHNKRARAALEHFEAGLE